MFKKIHVPLEVLLAMEYSWKHKTHKMLLDAFAFHKSALCYFAQVFKMSLTDILSPSDIAAALRDCQGEKTNRTLEICYLV